MKNIWIIIYLCWMQAKLDKLDRQLKELTQPKKEKPQKLEHWNNRQYQIPPSREPEREWMPARIWSALICFSIVLIILLSLVSADQLKWNKEHDYPVYKTLAKWRAEDFSHPLKN